MRSRDRDDAPVLTTSQLQSSRELQWVDQFSRTLDTRLRVPGTNIRFGADFILGLVPGAGDMISLGLSGLLIGTMAKHGASPMLVIKMLGNVLLDTIVGSVPVLGNVFDLLFKANYRNLKLMRQYYDEDRHRGSVWPIMLTIFTVISFIAAVSIFVIVRIYRWILDAIGV